MSDSRVVAAYADGGVIHVNPSPIGGTWATCHVDDTGWRVHRDSGVLVPADVEAEAVTNNQTEFFGLLTGLEALPDGWSGRVCTDSLVTIRRFRDEAKLAGIPLPWRRRRQARQSGQRTQRVVRCGVYRGGPGVPRSAGTRGRGDQGGSVLKVIYTVDFAIEVDASTRNMAIHQAGEQWPELRQAVEGLGSGVTIKRIRVEGAEKAESAED